MNSVLLFSRFHHSAQNNPQNGDILHGPLRSWRFQTYNKEHQTFLENQLMFPYDFQDESSSGN